jgi:hypothetical protein
MQCDAGRDGAAGDEPDLTAADLVSRADELLEETLQFLESVREGAPIHRTPAGDRATRDATAACRRIHSARDAADDDDPASLTELRDANDDLETKLERTMRKLAPLDDELRQRVEMIVAAAGRHEFARELEAAGEIDFDRLFAPMLDPNAGSGQ